jgi:outer membrane protein assembly factor BamB
MHFPRLGASLALLIIHGLWCASTALAQPGFPSRFSNAEGTLLPAPREVEVLLDEAQQAISKQQWSEATLALGNLLGLEAEGNEVEAGQDYFIFTGQDDQVTVQGTVLRSAHALLSQLPEEGLKVVELRYGVKAAQMLEEAVAVGDWNRIQRIGSKYSFTRAGQDANLIMAEKALGDGNVREAANGMFRLLRMESARKRFGEPLGLMTIATSQVAKLDATAREALQLVRSDYPSFTVDWNGSKVGWNEKTTDESILQSLKQESISLISKPVIRPAYPGGDSLRNGETQAGLPLPILRWHVELHESFQHKDNLDRALKKQLGERKSVLIPTRYPIAVDSWILVPTYDQRVLAIDAKTGLVGWPCVFSGMPLGYSLDRFTGRDAFSLGLPAPDYLVRRVWGDTAVGQIASDGDRLFTLSELPAVDVAESFAQGPNARLMRPLGVRTFNVLQSWSIENQGKLVWEVGGTSGGAAPELAGALFLGAPLPYRGELFSLIELNGEIFLVSCSPETGKMLWRQPIAANQGTTISLDAQRRSYGASPAADGSTILCPTLSGFLVAYDLNNRELLWQHRYAMNPSLAAGAQFNFIGGMDARESNPTIPRSTETSVLLHDGVAIFAPPNGNTVTAINLLDGKELWQLSFDDPIPFRYIAGAHADTVALVQNMSILGIDLRTGKPKWKPTTLPGEAQVVGRSVRRSNRLLVPTSNQEILEVDMATGSILNTVRVARPLGNLMVVDDRLISASPFQLDCYSIRDVFESRLLEELQQDGETVRSLVKQGELHIASGEIDAALEVLERAYASIPNDPDVRSRLVEVATLALRNDFDKYVDRVQRYQDLTLDLDLPSYLRILVHGLEKQDRWEEALEKLIELSDARLNRRIDQMSDGEDVDMNPQWSIQEDRWIATRIARCAEKLPDDAWTRLDPVIRKRLNPDANFDRGVSKLRLEHMHYLPQSEDLRLLVAQRVLKTNGVEAERLLRQTTHGQITVNETGEPVLSTERKRLLAEIYLRSKRPYLALRYVDGDAEALRQLIEKISIDNRSLGMRMDVDSQQVAQFAEIAKSLETKHIWPQGSVTVNVEPPDNNAIRQFDTMSDAFNLCLRAESIGDSFDNWQGYYGIGGFQFFNRLTNEQFQRMIESGALDRSTVPRMFVVDSMIFLELRNELIAVDTLQAFNSQQDGQLWRNNYGDEPQEVERGRGRTNVIDRNVWGLPIQRRTFRVAAASRHGVVILSNDELTCLDLFSGARLWSHSGFRNATFQREGNRLYAYQPSTGQISHLDIRDGMILEAFDSELKGWQPISTVGKRWLFGPDRSPNGDRASEMKLRLVEPATGKTLLEREHTPDTRLAIVDDIGIVALKNDGQLTYWNVTTAVENNHSVDVEGKFSTLSAQVFGDVALILPYAGSMELERITVNPSTRTDPSVAPCAGRLFAISTQDGKPTWERSQRVKHFLFPLSQSRESPAAIFVRRLSLTKVRGQNLDFTSIAMVDVKTGRLLYQKHDLPAIRGGAFLQRLAPNENAMLIRYLGNGLTATWSDDVSGLAPTDQTDEIGELDPDIFRNDIEKKIDEAAARNDGK